MGDSVNLKIEYLPVDSLRPYEKNARKHGKKSVESIANSIEEFGFDDPVGIWGDNYIVEGHGRVQAAKKLGMEKVPCVRLDHLTDEQRRAYGLVHNKTAEVSDWDYDLLDLEISDLDNFAFDDFGFELVDEEAEHQKSAERTQQIDGRKHSGSGTRAISGCRVLRYPEACAGDGLTADPRVDWF